MIVYATHYNDIQFCYTFSSEQTLALESSKTMIQVSLLITALSLLDTTARIQGQAYSLCNHVQNRVTCACACLTSIFFWNMSCTIPHIYKELLRWDHRAEVWWEKFISCCICTRNVKRLPEVWQEKLSHLSHLNANLYTRNADNIKQGGGKWAAKKGWCMLPVVD